MPQDILSTWRTSTVTIYIDKKCKLDFRKSSLISGSSGGGDHPASWHCTVLCVNTGAQNEMKGFPYARNSTEQDVQVEACARATIAFTRARSLCIGTAGLATHGRNKLVQGASADPTLSFVPFSQSPTLDDQLSRFVKLLQQNQTLSLVPPRQAKLCAKACDEQRRQIHRKQKWSMEFCCSCFRVQMHNPLVHGSPHASMYHQGTQTSLLALRKLMTLGGLGVRDSPNTTG